MIVAKTFVLLSIYCALLHETMVKAEDSTWAYAVEISATVQTNPAQIKLTWRDDIYGVNSFVIYRKPMDDISWGAARTNLPGTVLSYTDTNVSVGSSYEYKIVKNATVGYTGYGYIFAGIQAPLIERRGKLLLIVATNVTGSLSTELARLQSDLIGDGWDVLRHDVSSGDSPANVRSIITNAYYADPTNVSCVFLFGHVPILQSGPSLNYDGHLARAMPADGYYGDMNDDWPTDEANSPGYFPSDVKLMVGRVDLANMPGNGAPVPWPSETELLRRYLNKDHNWRHKLIAVNRLALMGNLRGDENGEATATSGYRNFAPLVGLGNTVEANVEYTAPADQRWISFLARSNYLWAYGCGAGAPTAVSGLGTNDGTFSNVWSTDIVGQDAKAVFVMLFGSWFGNWDDTDDILRAVLATPTMGLTACMAGRPHWFFHHMGLGQPIGYGARLSMNNTSLYQNQSNGYTRAVYVGLMGDPTLRLDPVAPPTNLVAVPGTNQVTLRWGASPDSVAGYHVYRSAALSGPFERLSGMLIAGTNFTDTAIVDSKYTYMVRAVKLQINPSGSYFNPSQGVFVSVTNLVREIPPIMLSISPLANGVLLSWNSTSGGVYHVDGRTDLSSGSWSNLSLSVTANSSVYTWVDTNVNEVASRYYRVVMP
jgi:hypothetical protein